MNMDDAMKESNKEEILQEVFCAIKNSELVFDRSQYRFGYQPTHFYSIDVDAIQKIIKEKFGVEVI